MPVPGTRVELANSVHRLPNGATVLRPTNPNQWLELTLAVRRAQPLPDLAALDMTPPAQRRYMTHDELASTYGSDPEAVARIEAFAQAHSLVVTRDERGAARMGLAGTAADLSAAFGVTLFDYQHPNLAQFRARTGPVTVPAELAHDITGVFGFNNHQALRRSLRLTQQVSPTAAAAPARPWFTPPELAALYDFPQADTHIECIGVLEFGGGVQTADLDAYFAELKLPVPSVKIVALDGASADAASDPNSTGEVMLDIEVIGGASGGARIVGYFSTFDEKGLVDAIAAAIGDRTNKPSVLSISWGWDENQPIGNGVLWSPAAIEHVNQSFLAAAHLGITVCVSTGDDGSEAQLQDGLAHVNFPASSPYVLAVGGTTLHARRNTQGREQITELVWNNGPGSGTGGGVSDLTPRPSWQEGIVPASINPGGFAGRAIPDVAANADPNTGYLIRTGGQFGVAGGTSAAAPLWASLIARINTCLAARVGNFNALLYAKYGPAGVLRDIVTGNNDTEGLLGGQFAAKPGWDACTGWGVPQGTKLLEAMKTR